MRIPGRPDDAHGRIRTRDLGRDNVVPSAFALNSLGRATSGCETVYSATDRSRAGLEPALGFPTRLEPGCVYHVVSQAFALTSRAGDNDLQDVPLSRAGFEPVLPECSPAGIRPG